MTLRDEYVIALEAENEALRGRLAALEETMGLRIETPLMLGLTSHEAKLFGILLKRDMVTKDAAMVALYGDQPNSEVEIKIVDVFVCKARKKLKPYDIEIETVWGQGIPDAGGFESERGRAARTIEGSMNKQLAICQRPEGER